MPKTTKTLKRRHFHPTHTVKWAAVIQAAKATTHVLLLAAVCLPAFANIPRSSLVAEKPHQGSVSFALVSHRAESVANALIAPGLPGCLYDLCVKPCSSSKERDAETGLDYFGARYFSGAQGRFTSPDAPFADQHTIDPQSWNLYAYVRNNPLKNTDPNGRDCFQGLVSCANYVLGGVGAVGNAFTSGLVNLPNRVADGLAAPFNGGQRVFGDLVPDAFTPTNIDQRQGMEAANAVMLLSPLAELGAARAVSVTAAEVPLVTRNAARGAASEGRVLNDMGLTKNTTPITGTAGRSIPDINTSTVVGDIKDVKVVRNTSQMKIQREVAGQTGREHVIVTGTNTHVTKPTQQPPTRIIRRDDLGPPQ